MNVGPMTLDQRKQQFKVGFMEAFKEAIKVKQQKEIDEGFLLSLNVNSLDDLFEKYFEEMINAYTERAIAKIPNNKLIEFGTNMSRSLAGVIPKEGAPSAKFMGDALSSLKTDLYAKASFIEDYTKDLGDVMGKPTTERDGQSDYSNYIFSKIQNGHVKAADAKKVNHQPLGGTLGFAIGRPLNTVLSDPTFMTNSAKEYFRTYSNLVSGMLAQVSNSEKPFVKKQGKLNVLEPIVIEAICIYASQLALEPKMYVLDDKSQQLYARDLAKIISLDKSLTQKYQKGFVEGQATVERQNEVRDDISKSLHTAGLAKKDLATTAPEQSKRGSPLGFLRKQLQESAKKTASPAVITKENADSHKKPR